MSKEEETASSEGSFESAASDTHNTSGNKSTDSNITSVTTSSGLFVPCKLYDSITVLKHVYSRITTDLENLSRPKSAQSQTPEQQPNVLLLPSELVNAAVKKKLKPELMLDFVELYNCIRPMGSMHKASKSLTIKQKLDDQAKAWSIKQSSFDLSFCLFFEAFALLANLYG